MLGLGFTEIEISHLKSELSYLETDISAAREVFSLIENIAAGDSDVSQKRLEVIAMLARGAWERLK